MQIVISNAAYRQLELITKERKKGQCCIEVLEDLIDDAFAELASDHAIKQYLTRKRRGGASIPLVDNASQGKADIANMKYRSGELMKQGDMAAGIKLYNRAWEKERKQKGD